MLTQSPHIPSIPVTPSILDGNCIPIFQSTMLMSEPLVLRSGAEHTALSRMPNPQCPSRSQRFGAPPGVEKTRRYSGFILFKYAQMCNKFQSDAKVIIPGNHPSYYPHEKDLLPPQRRNAGWWSDSRHRWNEQSQICSACQDGQLS